MSDASFMARHIKMEVDEAKRNQPVRESRRKAADAKKNEEDKDATMIQSYWVTSATSEDCLESPAIVSQSLDLQKARLRTDILLADRSDWRDTVSAVNSKKKILAVDDRGNYGVVKKVVSLLRRNLAADPDSVIHELEADLAVVAERASAVSTETKEMQQPVNLAQSPVNGIDDLAIRPNEALIPATRAVEEVPTPRRNSVGTRLSSRAHQETPSKGVESTDQDRTALSPPNTADKRPPLTMETRSSSRRSAIEQTSTPSKPRSKSSSSKTADSPDPTTVAEQPDDNTGPRVVVRTSLRLRSSSSNDPGKLAGHEANEPSDLAPGKDQVASNPLESTQTPSTPKTRNVIVLTRSKI
eukprot:TRINITY_DN9864_c0_g2_i1.p1 TRINITY_DN9864_c0_g2~~TRINITY_DN9864_c0_g2_i1.p1  ORF type:complete len:356 (-),score=68.36 TRINITY_DN9864_c0_g2_i1:226-1293(-)